MAANINPIFSLTPVVSAGQIVVGTTTVLTKSDGTGTAIGTDMITCFTAGSNGAWVSRIRIYGTATAPTTATAGMLRLYISSKTSGATTSADTFLIQEVPVAALASDSATVAIPFYEFPCGFAINANYTILASLHATGNVITWQVIVFGGNY